MPYTEGALARTHYHHIGQHPQILVLLHGWANTWESWASLIPTLSAHYTLLIPDLPGFGLSEPRVRPDGWSMVEYASWLTEFLRDLRVESLAAVVGHSFGGKTAAFAYLTGQHELPTPDRGLFLLAASGICAPLPWTRRAMQTVLAWVPMAVKHSGSPVRRWYYERVLHETDYLHANAFQAGTLRRILRSDIRAEAQPGRLPLHIGWGGRDQEVPSWMAYEFAKLSTASDVFIMPGGGHFPHHEHPSHIAQWLKGHL